MLTLLHTHSSLPLGLWASSPLVPGPPSQMQKGLLGLLFPPPAKETPSTWSLLNPSGLGKEKPFLLTFPSQEPRQHITLSPEMR